MNILEEEKTTRNQHELFCERSKKRNCPGKYEKINEILCKCYWRCASNIYMNGRILKEEIVGSKRNFRLTLRVLAPQMGG